MDIPHTLVENLDAIAIVRRMVVEGVSLRRTLAVSEVLGWDSEKGDFKTHDVFRWDAKKDHYEYTGESQL